MTPLPQSGLDGIWKLLTVLMSPWLLSTRWPDGCFRLVPCNNGCCGGWSGVGGGQHQQTLFVVHASDPLELQHVTTGTRHKHRNVFLSTETFLSPPSASYWLGWCFYKTLREVPSIFRVFNSLFSVSQNTNFQLDECCSNCSGKISNDKDH